MTLPNTTGAQALSRAEVDSIVYACRQSGDDSTYAIVNAAIEALAGREQAGAVATLEVWQYPNTEMRMEDLRLTDQGKALPFGKYTLAFAAPGSAIAAREQEEIADAVVRMVGEMDDRTSPEDWPEAMLVTGPELHAFILLAFERAAESHEEAPAASAVPKWINDPHDIEQGQMLNPAWLRLHGMTPSEATAPEQSTAPNAELLRGWKRYEKLRKLTPAAFNRLHIVNVTGGTSFDDLVDALPEPSTPVPEQSAKGGDHA